MRRWVAETAETFGRIDVLINNASPWLMKPFLEVTEAEYDLCNDVTVKAAFFCTQAVAPFMLQQERGVIINIADLSVYEVWAGIGHHAIAKAGVVQLTRYAAANWARRSASTRWRRGRCCCRRTSRLSRSRMPASARWSSASASRRTCLAHDRDADRARLSHRPRLLY
jgi:NADP-dependent 3-hydroxy acid dehydrogenase YdfG